MKYILKNKGKGTHGGVNPIAASDLYRLDTPEVLNITDIQSRSYNDLQDLPTIPTNNTQLTNGSGYITGVSWTEVTGKPTLSITNWNTAYGWGDHSTEGYIKSFTNTTYSAGTGILLTGTTFSTKYGTTSGTAAQGNDGRILNGNTAFGWGNHATQGYLKTYTDTNTTYTPGIGLDLVGTEFKVEFGTTTNTVAAGNDSRITNGATAFSWGNHATQGYLTVDNNTTYSAGIGLNLSGSTFSTVYGTTTNTAAQGNDSRINNGQTAFSWGNHATNGYITGVSWTEVTGKPATFAPSAHNHDDRYYTEAEIDTKLAGVATGGHTHVVADITDFPIIPSTTSQLTNNSGYITGVSWTEVTSKPTTFAPSAHTHPWSEVTGKPTLDNYVSWNLKTNGTQRTTIGSNGNLDLIAGNNITLTYGAGGQVTIDAVTGAGADGNNYPTTLAFNTTDGILTMGRNGLSALTTDFDGRYSLTGHTHDYNTLTNKPTIPTVPTNVSAFTNDSGYVTGVSWIEVTGKPSEFTPSVHTHTVADITDFPTIPEGTADISASRSLTAADKGKTLICTGTINITIPAGLGNNFSVNLINDGVGTITLIQGAGTALKAPHGLKIGSDDCANILKRTGVETFYIQGTLTI